MNKELLASQFAVLPQGWTMSLVPQLIDELIGTLQNYVDDFQVVDCKEKFGAIRIYWEWRDREYTDSELQDLDKLWEKVDAVITKYERISIRACVNCGAPATHYTAGYILPLCEKCKDIR